MRILVTGHRGYIGSVLTSVLRHHRHEVYGLDRDWFTGCDFGRYREQVASFDLDIRDVAFADLVSFDAVIHLAGLSDDASAELDPALADEINHRAAVRLAQCCREAKVSRFVFASTCSVYGAAGPNLLDEDSPTRPRSAYATAKLAAEQKVLALASGDFTPVALRLATAYGVSPRLRLDLVVNDFVASAVTADRVLVRSAGHAWRPLIHVEDAARVMTEIITAHEMHSTIYNVVPTGENHRVIDIADAVTELLPLTTRAVLGREHNERSYKVDGSKFLAAYPTFAYRWTLAKGIRQLCSAFVSAGLTAGDYRCDRFRRVQRLQSLIERGELDASLQRVVNKAASTVNSIPNESNLQEADCSILETSSWPTMSTA